MAMTQTLIKGGLPAELFVDCSQREFVDAPMAVVEKVYSAFKLPLSAESRAAMQAHVDANPKGKHGKHEYNLAEFGPTRCEGRRAIPQLPCGE